MAKEKGVKRLSVSIRSDQLAELEAFRAERGDLALSATVRRVLDLWQESRKAGAQGIAAEAGS